MRRTVLTIVVLFAMSLASMAQNNAADVPTREDINRFFDTLQLRTQMQTAMEMMTAQMRKNAEEMLRKNMPEATPQDLARAQKMLDDFLNEPMPLNEIIDAMIPVYQRHLTHEDINAIVKFYSSPVGQKMVREVPAMMSEGMLAANDVMQKHMQRVMSRMREQMGDMKPADTPKK